MIDWRRGGRTGSINRWARREVREHLRSNATAVGVRYGPGVRALRRLLRFGTFGRLLGLYLAVDLCVVAAEALASHFLPGWLPAWSASGPPGPDVKALVLNVSSYLVSTQVGLLGVISLALALVTIVSQREGSATDVNLYYHESLSFELVASCLALLAVLCAQLLWPLQFLLHRLAFGSDLLVFKLFLLGVHLAWLLLNLGAAAYFIMTTFRFVQQSARERLRERYTANVVLPRDMISRVRHQLYGLASNQLVGRYGGEKGEEGRPSVAFGFDYGAPTALEVESTFARPTVLYDVRMIWVRWVVRRWIERSSRSDEMRTVDAVAGLRRGAPVLWFTAHLDHPMHGKCGWCRRRDGVPLTFFEKLVLRRAFRFRRSSDDA
jgi:hypothetical protein